MSDEGNVGTKIESLKISLGTGGGPDMFSFSMSMDHKTFKNSIYRKTPEARALQNALVEEDESDPAMTNSELLQLAANIAKMEEDALASLGAGEGTVQNKPEGE